MWMHQRNMRQKKRGSKPVWNKKKMRKCESKKGYWHYSLSSGYLICSYSMKSIKKPLLIFIIRVRLSLSGKLTGIGDVLYCLVIVI